MASYDKYCILQLFQREKTYFVLRNVFHLFWLEENNRSETKMIDKTAFFEMAGSTNADFKIDAYHQCLSKDLQAFSFDVCFDNSYQCRRSHFVSIAIPSAMNQRPSTVSSEQ